MGASATSRAPGRAARRLAGARPGAPPPLRWRRAHRSARADRRLRGSAFSGFTYPFYIEEPGVRVMNSFVQAQSRFGILERAGHLFVGVELGDLQAFAAISVNA